MEVTPYLMWNVLLTLVVAPLLYIIRGNASEAKRLDILLNKTIKQMAKDYVTKTELEGDMERVFVTLDKIEEKLDRLFEAK